MSAQISTAMTSAPCSASATAWLRPWPRAAPVTMATVLSSSPMTHRQGRAGLLLSESHQPCGGAVVAGEHRAADERRRTTQAQPAADADIATGWDRFADAVQRGRRAFVDVVGQLVGHGLDGPVRQRQ